MFPLSIVCLIWLLYFDLFGYWLVNTYHGLFEVFTANGLFDLVVIFCVVIILACQYLPWAV